MNERDLFVSNQLLCNGVTDSAVLNAFGAVDRRDFLSEKYKSNPFLDRNIVVRKGHVMLSPVTLAKMVQFSGVKMPRRVLDLGFSTGYSSFVLSFLSEEVVSVETTFHFVETLKKKCGERNMRVLQGPLCKGCLELAPYDIILCNGKISSPGSFLLNQLSEGGVLLAIMEEEGGGSYAFSYGRKCGSFVHRRLFSANAPYLVGFEKFEKFVF